MPSGDDFARVRPGRAAVQRENAEKQCASGGEFSMKMRFIDLHCDTMTRKGGTPLAEWAGHVTPEKLRRGGALAQCFALYILTREPALRRPDDLPPHAVFDR